MKRRVALLLVVVTCLPIFASCSTYGAVDDYDDYYETRSEATTQEIETEEVTNPQVVEKVEASFDYTAYGLPVLEFSGDTTGMSKENSVELTYKYGDREGSCTLKWQGSSSIGYPKKNYTVKFDIAFEAKEGWGEQQKYCLKANYIDYSHARNVCSAKLWGDIVNSRKSVSEKLASLPNGGAIDGFPICVVINGEYQGLYMFNIPKDAWMFGMGEGDQEAIVCADNSNSPACMFDGLATLDGDFEVEYAPDEDDTEWIKTSLNRLLQACVDCKSEEDFDNNVAQYLDVESAIDYMLFALLIGHGDGIKKNYILATYDGTTWFFSAYDMDSTYGLAWDGKTIYRSYACDINNIVENNRLFELLFTYKLDKVKARYNTLINGKMSEESVIYAFTDFIGGIPKAIYDQEVKLWPSIPNTSVNNIAQISDYYQRRTAFLNAQIESIK